VQELLHQAVILDRANLVRPLLVQGADPREKDDYGRTSLLTAIEQSHEEVVKGAYEEALWAAVSNRDIGLVKMLLAAQPRLPLWSTTTLVHAVVIGATEIAQMLIENGAAVTPYILLKIGSHCITPAIGRVEAETGNQSPSRCEGWFERHMRPLFLAVYAGHGALVDELLNAGADPREDVSILHVADEPSIIAQLLAADAKLHANSENTLLDMPVKNGDTALGAAAGVADVFWVKNLLSLGAEPAARGSHGMTPREIANGVGSLVDTADVEEVLAEAEEV
ncbi:MAG: hypothetical protein Q9178_007530, partial [Gyalolechia marmorata]